MRASEDDANGMSQPPTATRPAGSDDRDGVRSTPTSGCLTGAANAGAASPVDRAERAKRTQRRRLAAGLARLREPGLDAIDEALWELSEAPDVAFAGLVEGLRAADDPGHRARIIAVLCHLLSSDPNATLAILRERAESDPEPLVRALATAGFAAITYPATLSRLAAQEIAFLRDGLRTGR